MTGPPATPPLDVPAWSRRQLAGLALVGVLAVVLVSVRLAVPGAAGVTAGAGILVAFAAVAAAVLARRRVRALNRPSEIDRDRAERITEAHRGGVPSPPTTRRPPGRSTGPGSASGAASRGPSAA